MSKACVCYITHTSAGKRAVIKLPSKSGVGQQLTKFTGPSHKVGMNAALHPLPKLRVKELGYTCNERFDDAEGMTLTVYQSTLRNNPKYLKLCYDSTLKKTDQRCLPPYTRRFILAPKAMQQIKGSETKKHTYAHNMTSPLYVQFIRVRQETHNKACRRIQKMREIRGQEHFLIVCYTTRHQGRV
jgi:phosphopantetheine adenylyltransferase